MIKEIKAEKKGLLVERLIGNLTVVSVYKSVINLATKDGFLLSLVENKKLMSGFAISLPDLFNEKADVFRKSIKTKTRGIFYNSALKLLFNNDNEVLISLDGAEVWDGRISTIIREHEIDNYILSAELKKLVVALKRLLLVHGRKGGFLDILNESREKEDKKNHFVCYAKKVLKRENANRYAGKKINLNELIGLGIGFTPSGDDFITGCLLAEEMSKVIMRESELRPNNRVINREKLRAFLQKTNDGGRSLLYQVLEGIYPAYILNFVSSLCFALKTGDERIVEEAVKEMLRHGETSGTDTLTGFVWYFSN